MKTRRPVQPAFQCYCYLEVQSLRFVFREMKAAPVEGFEKYWWRTRFHGLAPTEPSRRLHAMASKWDKLWRVRCSGDGYSLDDKQQANRRAN